MGVREINTSLVKRQASTKEAHIQRLQDWSNNSDNIAIHFEGVNILQYVRSKTIEPTDSAIGANLCSTHKLNNKKRTGTKQK